MTQSQLLGVGLVASLCVTAFLARKDGVSLASAWGFLGAVAASALAGAALVSLLAGAPGAFSSIGALLGAGLVALVLRLRFPRHMVPLLDAVSPGALLALAFARLGCLLEGCDFGSPTGARFAVAYEAPHPVWFLHVTRGLVDAADAASAPIHPFPLYIVVPVMLLVIASTFVRGEAGKRAMFVTLGYAVTRAVAEWFRDPMTSRDIAGIPLGVVAACALGLVTLLWWIDTKRTQGRNAR